MILLFCSAALLESNLTIVASTCLIRLPFPYICPFTGRVALLVILISRLDYSDLKLCIQSSQLTSTASFSWDDWVPQDRLRKLTDEYRELAANLKKDLIAQDSRRQPAQTKSTKKGGKDERGSEGRDSAAPSSKRRKEKDNEIETVRDPFLHIPFSYITTLRFLQCPVTQ